MNKFYITTAIPYVNGRPHIGHTLEYFQADTIRRYRKKLGDETLLLSGADENALKNVQAAEKEGLPVQEFLDKYSKIWKDTYELVGVHLDVFQRGSDKEKHWPGVQKLWRLCEQNGDIYKKSYEGFYCVGCEAFKNEDELVDGLCPIHQKKPDKVSEENYFFKLSKYQEKLIELIESNAFKITPQNKRAEALSFIKQGLEDFSVSRSNERARGVGVPVPNDLNQKIYVWFDALNIYMTGIGFGWDEEKWKKWWPADIHVIGKDINRFHTVYWPAMLLSAGLPLPKQILIHGFVNAKGGEKFSKSLNNAPEPKEVIEKYGLEAVRYYMLSQVPIQEDHDFTFERFEEVYNADLANNLGNLVARIAKLCEQANFVKPETADTSHIIEAKEYSKALEEFRFNEAFAFIFEKVNALNLFIDKEKPWELIKNTDPRIKEVLAHAVDEIQEIASLLEPFLPETAEKIQKQFEGSEIKALPPLFPRI
ncbi:MAG: methionine--tRNA ligase [Candidatus Levybacteria bacterium]|nr:methionine--tRNA ligase [Candidatus Levybacteria bacterium]MBI2421029.1 methionine--tRNA ligase [Candidatus Levybacteria bacterium]